MKTLITGARGMLGMNLIKELVDRGHEVIALDLYANFPHSISVLDFKTIQGSIMDHEKVKQAIKGCEVVIHAAALVKTWPTRSPQFHEINVEGTEVLINAALVEGVQRFIYVGSASSFGYGNMENPGTERNPFTGSRYGLDYIDTKYVAQQVVLQAAKNRSLPAIVINPTYMIGPYDTGPGSGQLILSFYLGKFKAIPPGGKNFVHTRDVAIAIVNAIDKGKIGECYIAGHENLDYARLTRREAKALNMEHYGVQFPSFLVKMVGALSHFFGKITGKTPFASYPLAKISCDKQFFSPKKAVEELQMPQTPIETAIKDAIGWFESNGYVNDATRPLRSELKLNLHKEVKVNTPSTNKNHEK